MMQQPVYIYAGTKLQADRACRAAGLPPAPNDRVRYVFDLNRIRAVNYGFILCLVGAYSDRDDLQEFMRLAQYRQARTFFSLDEALQAAMEPAP